MRRSLFISVAAATCLAAIPLHAQGHGEDGFWGVVALGHGMSRGWEARQLPATGSGGLFVFRFGGKVAERVGLSVDATVWVETHSGFDHSVVRGVLGPAIHFFTSDDFSLHAGVGQATNEVDLSGFRGRANGVGITTGAAYAIHLTRGLALHVGLDAVLQHLDFDGLGHHTETAIGVTLGLGWH